MPSLGNDKKNIISGERMIKVHQGLNIVTEDEKENIYPQGIIRIIVTNKHMKISANYGYSLAVDIAEAQSSMQALGWDDDVSYKAMAEKYHSDNGECRVTSSEDTKRYLEDICIALREENIISLRLCVMGLLMKLCCIGEQDVQRLPVCDECTPSQAVTARAVYSFMMRRMDEHITVEQIAGAFGISQTQIKDSFKLYYGEPVFAYIRKDKILAAARMLRLSDDPVTVIASRCGYASAGKFTRAFSYVMNKTPREYRSMT